MSALTGKNCTRWYPEASGGGNLSGRIHHAEGTARGSILVLHGYSEYAGRHDDFIQLLTAAGFDVYDYDQRGFGDTTLGHRGLVRVSQLVGDHIRVRRQISTLTGRKPLILFGHSLGGLVTARSALRRRDLIDRVILSAPALKVPLPPVPEWALDAFFLASKIFPLFPTAGPTPWLLSRDPKIGEQVKQDPLIYHRHVRAASAVSMIKASRSVLQFAGTWSHPALVLQGTGDEIVDPDGARQFVETAGQWNKDRPEVGFVEFPGAYHELFNDLCRDEFFGAILGYLGALQPSYQGNARG